MIIIKGYVEKHAESTYVAWAEDEAFKGVVVQGKSFEEVKRELWISLKVHVAYNLGVDISNISGKEIKGIKSFKIFEETEHEFKLQLV